MSPLLLLLPVVFGCTADLGPAAKQDLPPGSDQFARGYIALLRQGDATAAGEALAAEARNPVTPSGLVAVAHQLRGELAETLALVGFQYSSTLMGSGEWRHYADLSYQVALLDSMPSGRRYVLATVSEKDSLGKLWVVRMHTSDLTGPLERINAFTLSGRSPVHYVMLGLAVLVPLFILAVEIVCLRTPIRRKWAWLLVILLAAPVTLFNWTTGEAQTQSFSVLFFGAGWFRSGVYAPVILEWAFPMGAVIFLTRRYQLILRARHMTKEGYTKLNLPGTS